MELDGIRMRMDEGSSSNLWLWMAMTFNRNCWRRPPPSLHFVVHLSEQQCPETAPGRDTSSLQHKTQKLIFRTKLALSRQVQINQCGWLVASCNWWLKTSCSFSPPESPHVPSADWSSECLPMISLIQTSLRKSPGSGMPFSKKRLAIEGPQCLRLPCKSARHKYD